MRRLAALLIVLSVTLGGAAHGQPAFSPTPWLQDLDQLRIAMTTDYANLEWQAQRGLDLPALYAKTQERIEGSHDEFEARHAFERFLSAFGDGHLEVHWPAANTPGAGSHSDVPSALCGRLGYFDLHDDGGAALRLPGATAVGSPNAHLKAALVEMAGRRVAILRVGMFSQDGYPDICDVAAHRLSLTAASSCDQPCQDSLDQVARTMFVEEMARQVRALAAAHPDVLLVDIAGNGGGNDSSLALAHMLTDKRLQRPRGGGVQGPAWAAEIASREAEVAKALAARSADRAALLRFQAALAEARVEAPKACDRKPLWLGQAVGCSALKPEPLFNGFWSYVPKPDDPVAGAQTIWTGPLLVLVDGDSASSSEWFAAMLQDSKAATILGSPTIGAGCGHVTDTPPVKLAHSGGAVSMPDCYRLRANGDNEVGGVEPDLLIGFREHDTPAQRTARLARALPPALTRAIARR